MPEINTKNRHKRFHKMVNTKTYNVSFFQAAHNNNLSGTIADNLIGGFQGDSTPLFPHDQYIYRVVAEPVLTGVYRGQLKRYGKDDLPHAGTPDGTEREIVINEDEMTIERNYFLFFQEKKLLVWQENRRASSVTMLGRYMSNVFASAIYFNPVMTADATRDLMLEKHPAKSIEFTVARPLNPAMYDPNDQSTRVMDMLAGLNGLTGQFKISANKRGVRGRVLDPLRTLALGNSLAQSGQASRVLISLEGVDHPIDLIMDRLRGKAEVEMRGRYPDEGSIYAELNRVYSSLSTELEDILG